MSIINFLQKNKLFVHYASIVVIILGIMIILNMQREARPNVNFNRVTITVVYTGASPADIEDLVIDPIEEKIAEVDGIEEYRSVSYIGAGAISVKIDDSYPDPDDIIDEIRRKVSEVDDLPAEVDDPLVTEHRADKIPVLNVAMFGNANAYDLKMEAEKFKDFIQGLYGVQSVEYTGIGKLQLKIRARLHDLEKYDITLNEIYSKLSSWIKQKPGGLF